MEDADIEDSLGEEGGECERALVSCGLKTESEGEEVKGEEEQVGGNESILGKALGCK